MQFTNENDISAVLQWLDNSKTISNITYNNPKLSFNTMQQTPKGWVASFTQEV